MRHRIELVTPAGPVHRAVCRSWPSAWRAVQRELARDASARIRVVVEDDGSHDGREEALVVDGLLVAWHGRTLATPARADAAPLRGR